MEGTERGLLAGRNGEAVLGKGREGCRMRGRRGGG